MILLDTKVASAMRRLDRAGANFADWARSTPASDLYLSSITVMEIEVGILSMERKDRVQGAMLRLWMETRVLPGFEGKILPFDSAVARRCARLHVPDRRPDRDAMIAATALVHGMTVATRNTGDFAPTGVALVNPWEAVTP